MTDRIAPPRELLRPSVWLDVLRPARPRTRLATSAGPVPAPSLGLPADERENRASA